MNNECLNLIKTRRSWRRFENRQVLKEQLDAVLEAGTYAPTGRGMQSPVIVAVQDPDTLRELVKLNASILGTDSNPYYGAPTVLLVFADSERNTCVEDGSCVLNTLMLAAHAVGLCSCWIHREREMFETPEGRALMKRWGLPDRLIGIGALALGYPEGKAPAAKPRKPDYIVRI